MSRGNSPLHLAVLCNCPVHVMWTLLELGASVHSRNDDFHTPLSLALQCGNAAAAEALLHCETSLSRRASALLLCEVDPAFAGDQFAGWLSKARKEVKRGGPANPTRRGGLEAERTAERREAERTRGRQEDEGPGGSSMRSSAGVSAGSSAGSRFGGLAKPASSSLNSASSSLTCPPPGRATVVRRSALEVLSRVGSALDPPS